MVQKSIEHTEVLQGKALQSSIRRHMSHARLRTGYVLIRVTFAYQAREVSVRRLRGGHPKSFRSKPKPRTYVIWGLRSPATTSHIAYRASIISTLDRLEPGCADFAPARIRLILEYIAEELLSVLREIRGNSGRWGAWQWFGRKSGSEEAPLHAAPIGYCASKLPVSDEISQEAPNPHGGCLLDSISIPSPLLPLLPRTEFKAHAQVQLPSEESSHSCRSYCNRSYDS